MTAPHIVDPAAVLGELLAETSPDMMRSLLQTMLNALLSADADAVVGAEYGRPTPGRLPSAMATAIAETGPARNEFFADLVTRGLSGVRLVTSDAYAGLIEAITASLPGACWRRCRTHYTANLMAVTAKSL